MQRLVRELVRHHHHHHHRISHRIFHTTGGSAHIHHQTPKPTQLGHPFHRFHSCHSSNSNHTKIRSCLSQQIIAFNSHSNALRRISILYCRPRLPTLHSRFNSNRSYGSYRRRRRRRGRRSWFDFDSVAPDDMVCGLIKANAATFLLWWIASEKFMIKNFTLTMENINSGRLHTLITNAFSHVDFGHIFLNMLGLYIFGTDVARNFGSGFLLRLYLAGAVGGSVLYLVKYSKGWRNVYPSAEGLGASGALYAVVMLEIFLFIPCPLVWLVAFWIGKDILKFIKGDTRNTSGCAYLGGGAVAAIAWARVRRGVC